MIRAEVCDAPFDAGAELARLAALGGGGVASFVGIVRGDDGLTELLLEHHPRMTLQCLAGLAAQAIERWTLLGATILHRHGRLAPGDPIVFVGTAARHRTGALDACHSLIDRLKTDAPFWKHETFADGRQIWVEPRAGDAAAAARWLRGEP